MVDRGELSAAGAILDDNGTMIGSVLFMEFPSRTELDAGLGREPYVTKNVWQHFEVKPFRLAERPQRISTQGGINQRA